MKQMRLTDNEYEILEGKQTRGFRCAGQREAEAKLEKAYRRLLRATKGRTMLSLDDAKELVHTDLIDLLKRDGWITLWKEAPPYVMVFNK